MCRVAHEGWANTADVSRVTVRLSWVRPRVLGAVIGRPLEVSYHDRWIPHLGMC